MRQHLYKALDHESHEIRLIRLKPGSFNDEVSVEIFHTPLSEAETPDYEALSYVWGPTENPHKILVHQKSRHQTSTIHSPPVQQVLVPGEGEDGSFILITQNLWNALRQLRLPWRARILWIDAISINQNDTTERSREVSRMGLIYARALQVIVWLGASSSDSHQTIRTLKLLGKGIKYDPIMHRCTLRPKSFAVRLAKNHEAIQEMKPIWQSIQALLRSKWFTRLWVVQEIKLSRLAQVFVGSSTIPWITFRSALYWIQLFLVQHVHDPETLDVHWFNSRIMPIFNPLSSQLGLWSVITETRYAECQDPRDRVYGVLNMLSKSAISRLDIRPDYSDSTENVFKAMTRSCIEKLEYNSLEILSICETRRSSLSALPSWVPDLSMPLFDSSPLCRQRASGNSKAISSISFDSNTLHMSGVSCGIISRIGDSVLESSDLTKVVKVCQKWWDLVISSLGKADASTVANFVKLIAGGWIREDGPPNKGGAPSLNDALGYWNGGDPRLDDFNVARFMYAVQAIMIGRRFGVSSEGLIGMFPAAIETGDKIFIPLGGTNPLIIRAVEKETNRHQLIGESYVAGIMEGEAFLGPLPGTWVMSSVTRTHRRIFLNLKSGDLTMDDPRLGKFPPGWFIKYEDFEMASPSGTFNDCWYCNAITPEGSWTDPRMDEKELKNRGVKLETVAII